MDDVPQVAAPLGAEALRVALTQMPTSPGVYRMVDAHGTVLYVGKAKNLKNRVTSYTRAGALNARIFRMVTRVARVDITQTRTEAEALLLEANLIRTLSPRYNILLKDDKSFPYILLAQDHPYGQIVKHRGPQKRAGKYYGPFPSVGAVTHVVTHLQRAFQLRPCSDAVFAGRTRPCLQYEIKRCSAPCVGYITEDAYAARMAQAQAFLEGQSRAVQDALAADMQVASAAQEYERAADLRDRIRALTRIQSEQAIHAPAMGNADVFALVRRGGIACAQVFFFRMGQNFGNLAYFPAHAEQAEDAEILGALLGQFYQSRVPPAAVYVSHPLEESALLEEALSQRAGYRVRVHHPQRGERYAVMQQVATAAAQALERHAAERQVSDALREGVARVFGLNAPPRRIEVYDNSHIRGSHATGAMIVARPGGFDKSAYRTFSIRDLTTTPGDDYAMLREVLRRRLLRLMKDTPAPTAGEMEEDSTATESASDWPDLILLDGGAGQLSAATQVFRELGLDIPYAGIAKGPERNAGRETFFLPGKAPFQLPHNDPVLHYLQRLRDEAHRFAITTHRNKRSRAVRDSGLDAIPGIGGTRKRALLQHFGSARAVREASIDDLTRVPGISRQLAESMYGLFHGS